MTKYDIFCKVVDSGSFTRAAEQLGYSQSAVSQTVQALEHELGSTLVSRGKGGVALTKDGESYLPYIKSICTSEAALMKKMREMQGLENSVIRIGTFTSVSRNLLPRLMGQFKTIYPKIHFVLQQGNYSDIGQWVLDGSVDFGFVNPDAVTAELEICPLFRDEMLAVLPENHPLSNKERVSLRELSAEPFILLDEGKRSVPLDAFSLAGCQPRIEYKVYDDYSIIAMVRHGLGVSMLYRLVLAGYSQGVALKSVIEPLERSVAMTWRSRDTLSLAARNFVDFTIKESPKIIETLPIG